MASRTCFTGAQVFVADREPTRAHPDAGVAEVHVRQSSLPAARGDHGDVLQNRAFAQKTAPFRPEQF
jgi:hypothetical protein